MNNIEILQDYNPHKLAEKINEFIKANPQYAVVSVTIGPDNGPGHLVSAEVYTAWLELGTF